MRVRSVCLMLMLLTQPVFAQPANQAIGQAQLEAAFALLADANRQIIVMAGEMAQLRADIAAARASEKHAAADDGKAAPEAAEKTTPVSTLVPPGK